MMLRRRFGQQIEGVIHQMSFRKQWLGLIFLAVVSTTVVVRSQTTTQGSEDKNVPRSQSSTGKAAKATPSPTPSKAPKAASAGRKNGSGVASASPTPMVAEKLFNAMRWRQVGDRKSVV